MRLVIADTGPRGISANYGTLLLGRGALRGLVDRLVVQSHELVCP